MKNHLLYHITPIAGNALEFNLKNLLNNWSLFTGKKFIAVAEGQNIDLTLAQIIERFPKDDKDLHFVPIPNDPDLRETASFLTLLNKLYHYTQEHEKDSQITTLSSFLSSRTFYGHTKAVSRTEYPAAMLWTAALYYFNLYRFNEFPAQILARFPTAGAFSCHKTYSGFALNSRWHYSGTFFWFLTPTFFAHSNWRNISPTRYGAEGHLGTLFAPDNVGSIFAANIQGDMYDFQYVKKLLGYENIKAIEKATGYILPPQNLPQKQPPNEPESVSVIITTHDKAADLPVILGSLANQHAYVEGTHSRNGGTVKWVAGTSMDIEGEIVITCDGHYEGIHELNENTKLLECPKLGKVGHHTREPGIMAAEGTWTVLTNSDNYFVQGWLSAISPHLKPKNGMVVWDTVSNLWQWTTYKGSKIEKGAIDLSSVCVRSEVAKSVGWPNTDDYDGDFDYILACYKLCVKKQLNILFLPMILSIHN